MQRYAFYFNIIEQCKNRCQTKTNNISTQTEFNRYFHHDFERTIHWSQNGDNTDNTNPILAHCACAPNYIVFEEYIPYSTYFNILTIHSRKKENDLNFDILPIFLVNCLTDDNFFLYMYFTCLQPMHWLRRRWDQLHKTSSWIAGV